MDFADDVIRIKRLSSRNGRAVAVSDFVLSAGFGTTAAVTLATGSTETCGTVTITCGGTGQGANPTCTLTFPGLSWRNDDGSTLVPVGFTTRATSATQPTIPFQCGCTATTAVFTFIGTASGSEVYVFNYRICA